MEERLDRLERLAYLAYVEIRQVADYAYVNARLEVEGDVVKRMPKMGKLTDGEAIKFGMDGEDLVALKWKHPFLVARCRQEALEIAKYIADERKRLPASPQANEEIA
jgi:hypothetical protein